MHRLTKELFLRRYKEKHNKEFDGVMPDNFYGGHCSLTIKCVKHGDSQRSAFAILGATYPCQQCGKDCRTVSNKNNSRNIKLSLDDRIIQFREIHGYKFDYPEQKFQNSHSKIKILCKKHGEFFLHMHSHIKGVGCPICRKENKVTYKKSKRVLKLIKIEEGKKNRILANKARTIPKEEIEKLFRDKHGNKFQYDWEGFTGKSGKVTVICEKHNRSRQIIDEHLRSVYGCPSCANYSSSLAEQLWISKFNVSDRQFRINLDNGFMKVDGYDSCSMTIYEYLGDYWHGHPVSNLKKSNGINQNNKLSFGELFSLTESRFRLLQSMGYNIVYVWERDIKSSITDRRVFKDKLEYD